MERIAAMEPGIGTALDLEQEFFQSQDQRLAYIADMMEFWDVEFWDEKSISGRREEAALARGRAEGEAKGRAEGEAKNRAETARRMLDMNFTSEQIAQVTGLSPDEINALRDGQS